MPSDRERAKALLASLVANGLENDMGEECALHALMFQGKVMVMNYLDHYTYETEDGRLVFQPGTTMSTVISDLLLDGELRCQFSVFFSFLKSHLANKVHYVVSEYLVVHPDNLGQFSDYGIDYTEWKDSSSVSLESLFHDADILFPKDLLDSLAGEYGLKKEEFLSWLDLFSFTESLVRGGQKLSDRILLNPLVLPKGFLQKRKEWNSPHVMVGHVVLLADEFLKRIDSHSAFLEQEVLESLEKYGFPPERLGLL